MPPPPQKDLSEQLSQTQNWEAWANREQIIGEHVRNLYNAQTSMAKVIAVLQKKKPITPNAEAELYEDLYTKMYTLLCQVDIKIDKLSPKEHEAFMKKAKVLFQSLIERLVAPPLEQKDAIKPVEIHNAITWAAQTYDYLGYTAAERKIIRSRQLSDVAASIQDDYKGEEIDI